MNTNTRLYYKAFGLYLFSEIPLPEVTQTDNTIVDVNIKLGELQDLWQELSPNTNRYFVMDNYVLFKVPDTAIFLITDGKEIIISAMDGASLDKIRLFLLGTCMGILLMQREFLPLHGSAIEIDGKAYAFVGDSGAGKSTLATAFLNRGYQLISDDVIAISLSKDNVPIVTPSYPQQKLWQESLSKFNMEYTNYQPIFERETKFAVPVINKFYDKQLPLAGVFEIVKTENEEIQIYPIENLERFTTLYNHTYRQFLISSLGLLEWHFNLSARMISNIDLYQIRRPISYFTANDITSLVLSTINSKEGVKI